MPPATSPAPKTIARAHRHHRRLPWAESDRSSEQEDGTGDSCPAPLVVRPTAPSLRGAKLLPASEDRSAGVDPLEDKAGLRCQSDVVGRFALLDLVGQAGSREITVLVGNLYDLARVGHLHFHVHLTA